MTEFAKETLPISLEEEMRRSYLDYAMSVIVGRALPDARDGLKPVHRRVLYSMHEANNVWNRPYVKCARVPMLHVGNKCDAVQALPEEAAADDWVNLSAQTGQGLDTLRQRLLQLVGWQGRPEGTFIARQRHVQALQQVAQHIGQAQQNMQHSQVPLDVLAEDLRLAQNALNSITGEFTSDDLLGEIFGRFCIGK